MHASLMRKNRELYDDTFGRIWRQAIFAGLHGGHEFINLGGERLLGIVGHRAALKPSSRVLELCSGPGAVAAHLAGRYGCSVTGIDINTKQIAHARSMSQQLGRRHAARLTFINADACSWRPRSPFEVVISVDAFMLLADPGAALRVAGESLVNGGRLFVATLAAGPRLGRSFRRFAAEVDGMVSLRSAHSYTRLARAVGFRGVRVTDITPMAVRASVNMLGWLRRVKSGDDWIRVSECYLDAFTGDRLRYLLVSARKPSADCSR